MNSFDFVESVVTNALAKNTAQSTSPSSKQAAGSSSVTPTAIPQKNRLPSAGSFRPSSAASVISNVSTLPAGRNAEAAAAAAASKHDEVGRRLFPRSLLEPIQLTRGGGDTSLSAEDAVSAESALLFAQCNALVPDMPQCIARLAKEDTVASRNTLQLLWMVLVSTMKPSLNVADEQRRLLVELTSPSFVLQLSSSLEDVDVARRSALGSTIAVERVPLAVDVMGFEAAEAKTKLEKATASFHVMCVRLQDALMSRQMSQKAQPSSAQQQSVQKSDNADSTTSPRPSCSSPRAALSLRDGENLELIDAAREKWLAQLAYAKALERKAFVQFIDRTCALKSLSEVAGGGVGAEFMSSVKKEEFDGAKILSALRQRSNEISHSIRVLQRRPSDSVNDKNTSTPQTKIPTTAPASSSCTAEHQQLTQLYLERNAIRQSIEVVERCLRDQRLFLSRLEADRRAFAQSRLAEESTRRALQDESMYRAQLDTSLRKRVVGLEKELKTSQAALVQEQEETAQLRHHVAALRAGSFVAGSVARMPSRSSIDDGVDRPRSASSLNIMTYHRAQGQLSDASQHEQVTRLSSEFHSKRKLDSVESPVCPRCSFRRGDDGENRQQKPHSHEQNLSLSELNDKLYYSRRNNHAAEVEKIMSRLLNESAEGSSADKKKKKTDFTRDEVKEIVHRMYVKQIEDHEVLREKLFETHVSSKEMHMPRRGAEEIDSIVSRLAKGKD